MAKKGRINFNNLSLTVRKKGGKPVETTKLVNPFSRPIWLETKKGPMLGYYIDNPKELNHETKQAIFDDFYPVAVSAFAQNKSEAFQEDVYDHLFNVGGLILAFSSAGKYRGKRTIQKGIAFRTFSVIGQIAYIEGTAVEPGFWGRGLYQSFTEAMIKRLDVKYFASRTQNPVVLTALHRVFGNLYPISDKPDQEVLDVAKTVACFLKMKNYDEQEMKATGTYGGRLSMNPQDANNNIEKTLNQLICPDNGDCVIAVCKL